MKPFRHPKNPLSKENSVKPAPLGASRSFLWIFMIIKQEESVQNEGIQNN